jgi:hypothetical protein
VCALPVKRDIFCGFCHIHIYEVRTEHKGMRLQHVRLFIHIKFLVLDDLVHVTQFIVWVSKLFNTSIWALEVPHHNANDAIFRSRSSKLNPVQLYELNYSSIFNVKTG